uniref:hypothetical protein n=1 Tax=Rheinheimera sp. TaxID=1869214 RepID=UPI004048579B
MAVASFDTVEEAFRLFWDDFSNRIPDFLQRIGNRFLSAIPAITRGLVYPFPDPRSSLAVAFDVLSGVLNDIGDLTASAGVSAVVSASEAVVLNSELDKKYNSRILKVNDAIRMFTLLLLEKAREHTSSPDSGSILLLQKVVTVGGLRSKIVAWLKLDFATLAAKSVSSLLKRFSFLIVQLLIIVVQIGIALGISVIAIELMNDANNNPKIALHFALRQDKKKKP